MNKPKAALRALALGLAFTLGDNLQAADIFLVDSPSPHQKAIVVQGEIETGDSIEFYELARKTPHALVYLESPGGSVEAGLSIGAEIAIRGFTTIISEGKRIKRKTLETRRLHHRQHVA